MSSRIEPPISDAAAPFWEATKRREFVLQWCRDCSRVVHYPREVCPFCFGTNLEFRPASGRGEVYASSVMHRPGNPAMESRVPYVVALIDVAEGARMMSNVIDVDPGEVRVGMKVRLSWEDLSDGRALPVWKPEEGET